MDVFYAKAARSLGFPTEYELSINSVAFNIIDTGDFGFSLRRWFKTPVFENVTAILFLVSSIAYDQLKYETLNCLVDSCDLFEVIINSRFFADSSIILFFTKADLLEEKIKHSNIKEYFPEFQGDSRKLEDVQSFIFQMFDDRRKENSRALFRSHHFRTTTDPNDITLLFHLIWDTYPCKACAPIPALSFD